LAHATTGTKISSYDGDVGDDGMEDENGETDRVGDGDSLNAIDMDALGILLESKAASMA
jgi:hypothetical protein